MGLQIEYIDATSDLNLYSIIYASGGRAYRKDTGTFQIFSDFALSLFATSLTEDINRTGRYISPDITGTSINSSNIFTIEIRQRIGASVNKSADLLKSTSLVYWDGNKIISDIDPPKILKPSYLGRYSIGGNVGFSCQYIDKFGNNATPPSTPSFEIFDATNNFSTGVSGSASSITDGNLTFSFSTATLVTNKTYYVKIILDKIIEYIHFDTFSAGNITSTDVENAVIAALAYPTGSITVATSTSSFTTNLPATQNSYYNGQVLRMKSGPAASQGRIISGYNGTTKVVTVNKPFTLNPGTNSFIIFPIGGELNVPS
jgi:hypothetical protein